RALCAGRRAQRTTFVRPAQRRTTRVRDSAPEEKLVPRPAVDRIHLPASRTTATSRTSGASRVLCASVAAALVLTVACGGGGGDDGPSGPAPAPQETPQYRAIAGISMGGDGALNLGTRHRDIFGTVAALGGPVDLRQLLA